MTPTPTPAGALQVGISLQPGPDGAQWVGLHLTTSVQLSALEMAGGEITFMVAVTADAAMQMSTELPKQLQDAAREARKPKLVTAKTLPPIRQKG